MAFTEYDKRSVGISKEPFVTLQRRGTLSLNRAAFNLMGSPEAVTLLYDDEEELIGFKSAELSNPRAFPARPQGANGSNYVVAGQAFTKHFGIDTSTARRYGVEMRGDVLTVDLRSVSTDATGPRVKTREPA